ncbi:hypothetical protein [Lacinutrix jangbogonensis]|uniref:hypothetical protein n=1 Tax=Lacinutrix jangbogonensis TaxID=1469557 RepID=UPI00053D43E8|nr:hypothetical protein [Lacinutrix jangbogonensis]
MTESQLNKIESRLNNSTKGNWIPMIEGITHDSGSDFIMTNVKNKDDYDNPKRGQDIELNGGTKDDIIFIANAKQDIQKMIIEIRNLKSKTK